MSVKNDGKISVNLHIIKKQQKFSLVSEIQTGFN